MSTDPFKARVTKPQPKRPLILTESKLKDIILNATRFDEEKTAEQNRLEELKQRQEATKAYTKFIKQGEEPDIDLKKMRYAADLKQAKQQQELQDRLEARRSYVLDQAYKRLYEETDRVKYFTKAKNLAEMLHGRDKQVEERSKKKNVFKMHDMACILKMIRDIDDHEREGLNKLKKVKEDKKKNADNWKKQMEMAQKKTQQDDWMHIKDGYAIRDDALGYAEEQKKAELKEKKKKEEYKTLLDNQRDQKLALHDMFSRLDEADEKRAEIFNETKRDMKVKHREVKQELDEMKERKRQYVADNMKDESFVRKLAEEANLQKAIRETEAKNKEECAIKRANQEEALKSIQDFYEKELEAKAKRQMDDKRKAYEEGRRISELVERQTKQEDCKKEDKIRAEGDTQHIQLHQMAKKQMDRHEEKLQDTKDYLNHMKSLFDEEEVFQKYAEIEINKCKARGMDVKPMLIAARPGIEGGKGPLFKERGSIRPRYYSAASHGDDISRVDRVQKTADTKARLGFMLH